MRFHERDYAYDIEPQRDPSTQLLTAWRFTVYHLRPVETVVQRGEGKTREEAEAQAKKITSNLIRTAGHAA